MNFGTRAHSTPDATIHAPGEGISATLLPSRVSGMRTGHIIQRFMIPVAMTLLVAFLSLYNLTGYPPPWFDEGLNFQPARNLILYGQYALRSSEGFRMLDPAIQTGPPVILPVALSFKLLGIGLFQARLVTAFSCILGAIVYQRIARTLYNRKVGWLALILLLTFAAHNEFVSYLYMGRQVLGEVTALFFFLGGLLLWFQGWKRIERRYLIGAGLLFGLAMITKSQFSLLVPPSIFVVWLIGASARILRLRHLMIPAIMCAIPVLTWYGCQIAIIGPQSFFQNLSVLRTGTQLHVLNFSWITTRHSLGTLTRTGYVIWGGAGLLYAFWHNRKITLITLQRLALLVFVGVWLAWYVIGSIGWARYAFIPLALSHIFYTALLYDALKALPAIRARFVQSAGERVHRPEGSGMMDHRLPKKSLWLRALAALSLLAIACGMMLSGSSTIGQILRNSNDAYFRFARYLEESIPRHAVVESWEWELDLITDLCYHHPPTWVTNAFTQRLWAGDMTNVSYDPKQYTPTYLIIGPFARYTGLYSETGLLNDARLQIAIGGYELYQVPGSSTFHIPQRVPEP